MARWVGNRLQVRDSVHVVCPLWPELTNRPLAHISRQGRRVNGFTCGRKQNDSVPENLLQPELAIQLHKSDLITFHFLREDFLLWSTRTEPHSDSNSRQKLRLPRLTCGRW